MAQLGVLEALRCGTTTAMEISPGIEVYAREIVESGLRLILAEQASDRAHGRLGDTGPFEVDSALGEHGLRSISDLHAKWSGKENGRVTVAVAGWALDMVSPGLLIELRELQEKAVLATRPAQVRT